MEASFHSLIDNINGKENSYDNKETTEQLIWKQDSRFLYPVVLCDPEKMTVRDVGTN